MGVSGHGKGIAFLRAHLGYQGDDCVIWPFARIQTGYGQLGYMGKVYKANRLMCILAHGEPPTPKHESAHSCGNGHLGCVNPRHLSWATYQENQQERWQRRRVPRHKQRAAFTAETLAEVKRLAETKSYLELANMFGVCRSTIKNAVEGRMYTSTSVRHFSPEEVRLIRSDRRARKEIAAQYGVNTNIIYNLQTRRTYSHVE
jgi:hypothetical protein